MRLRSFAAVSVLSTALAAGMLVSPAAFAQEPTIHQVYEAAEAGKFIEAQKMMDQVLAAHPNSAKAHFIEAELLAKQGKLSRAATELATAERLGPDGKFAKPEAVQRLKAVLAAAPAAGATARPVAATPPSATSYGDARQMAPAERSGGMPWGAIFGIGALVLLAVMFFKRKAARQNNPQMYGGGQAGYGGGAPQYPNGGMPPQYGAPGGMLAAGGMGGMGGMGSGIVGGLATGAALGAGMVAGQALAHHFTDSNQTNRDTGNHLDSGLTPGAFQNDTPPSNYDMGGNDFGVSDSGGWDSGSDSGGGGDWD